MKTASLIARCLLGLIFFVFGLNGFLHVIPMMPMPQAAVSFYATLIAVHLMPIISALQVITGLLLLVNRYVPLALVVLGPIIVNIILFHILLAPTGLPLPIVVTILWVLVAVSVKPALAGIFERKV